MKKNGDAEALLDDSATRGSQSESPPGVSAPPLGDKPAAVSQSDSPLGDKLARLRNWKHEEFARQIAAGTEPSDAYVLAGFERHRANYRRLMRQPQVARRIDVLRREREIAARAARVPINRILEELDRRGIMRIEDLFERNAAGVYSVRNLQTVPVEVSIAFVRVLDEGFGIREK